MDQQTCRSRSGEYRWLSRNSRAPSIRPTMITAVRSAPASLHPLGDLTQPAPDDQFLGPGRVRDDRRGAGRAAVREELLDDTAHVPRGEVQHDQRTTAAERGEILALRHGHGLLRDRREDDGLPDRRHSQRVDAGPQSAGSGPRGGGTRPIQRRGRGSVRRPPVPAGCVPRALCPPKPSADTVKEEALIKQFPLAIAGPGDVAREREVSSRLEHRAVLHHIVRTFFA